MIVNVKQRIYNPIENGGEPEVSQQLAALPAPIIHGLVHAFRFATGLVVGQQDDKNLHADLSSAGTYLSRVREQHPDQLTEMHTIDEGGLSIVLRGLSRVDSIGAAPSKDGVDKLDKRAKQALQLGFLVGLTLPGMIKHATDAGATLLTGKWFGSNLNYTVLFARKNGNPRCAGCYCRGVH